MRNLFRSFLQNALIWRKVGVSFALIIAMVVVMFCGEKDARAVPTSATVVLNGQVVKFDAYNINDNNYFKLRDLAKTMSGTEKQFEVVWNEESKTIIMTSNAPYTEVGGEMKPGDGITKRAVLNTRPIFLDGKSVEITAYNIGGNNYFKLRDIAGLLDFGVDWIGDTATIEIDTSVGYTPEIELPTPTFTPTPSPSPTAAVPDGPTVPSTANWDPGASTKSTVDWMTANTEYERASDYGAYYHPTSNASADTALIAFGPEMSAGERVGIVITFHAWNGSDYAVWNEDGSVEFKTCNIVNETKALFYCLLGPSDGLTLYDTVNSAMKSHGVGWATWSDSFELHGRTIRLMCRESGVLKIYIS